MSNRLKGKHMSLERRRDSRVGISFPVECNLAAKKDYFYTVTKDLTTTGTKIISNDFLIKGIMVKVNINLIDRMLNVKARVAWCNREKYADRYTAGLEFTEITENGKRVLKHFLNRIYNS